MKKILFVFLFLVMAEPARADLDQLCLKQCMGSGATNASCMTQCSYGAVAAVPTPSMQPQASPANSHDVLTAPVPAGDALMLPHPSLPPVPDKDYSCQAACLHSGGIYRSCEERCAKTVCAPGDIICSLSVAGPGTQAAPAQAAPSYKPPLPPGQQPQ